MMRRFNGEIFDKKSVEFFNAFLFCLI